VGEGVKATPSCVLLCKPARMPLGSLTAEGIRAEGLDPGPRLCAPLFFDSHCLTVFIRRAGSGSMVGGWGTQRVLYLARLVWFVALPGTTMWFPAATTCPLPPAYAPQPIHIEPHARRKVSSLQAARLTSPGSQLGQHMPGGTKRMAGAWLPFSVFIRGL
jgi:hypothetical protein